MRSAYLPTALHLIELFARHDLTVVTETQRAATSRQSPTPSTYTLGAIGTHKNPLAVCG